jgi:hypothetical protein
MAAIIGMQLYRTVNIDQNERIAATRMFYYLILSAILYVSILLPVLRLGLTAESDFGSTVLDTRRYPEL